MSGNEPNISKWFCEYKEVLHDLGINSPEQIWSGDESGIQSIDANYTASVSSLTQDELDR